MKYLSQRELLFLKLNKSVQKRESIINYSNSFHVMYVSPDEDIKLVYETSLF